MYSSSLTLHRYTSFNYLQIVHDQMEVDSPAPNSAPEVNHIHLDKPNISFNQLRNYIYSKDYSINPSLITYRTIKFLVENGRWEKLLQNYSLDEDSQNQMIMNTSCLNTANLIEKILGLNLIGQLNFSFTKSISIPLESLESKEEDELLQDQGSVFLLKITSLLDEAPEYFNNGIPEIDWYGTTGNPYLNGLLRKFIETIKPEINKIQENIKLDKNQKEKIVNKYLSQLNYNFNRSRIDEFSKTILQNAPHVSCTNSFMYAVVLLEPPIKNNRYVGNSSEFKHVSFIEQYFSAKERFSSHKARYRLYQSMVGQATLKEEFKNRNFGDNEEGTWDITQLSQHLNNLQLYFEKNETKTFKDCYGYPLSNFPRFTMYQNALRGVTFRFSSSSFNPQTTVEKLAALINNHL